MKEKIKNLNIGEVLENINIEDYTTYKIKANAKLLVIPKNTDSLIKLLKLLKENNLKYKIIGNGSNLVFVNDYDGVLIKLDKFDNIEINDTNVVVGAGQSLVRLALMVSKQGLSGLEFASGIPGTVGGAIYMNAGAYKEDMSLVVKSVKVLDEDLNIKKIYKEDLDFGYRKSILQNKKYICLEVCLELKKGNVDEIMNLIQERKQKRLESQPLEYPNAGSVFRNPEGMFAGKLIEDLNLKGTKIGGAMVSFKHANFIVNIGNATGRDIKELITKIQNEVKDNYSVELHVEQEFVE